MKNADIEARLAALQVVPGTALLITASPRIGSAEQQQQTISYFGHEHLDSGLRLTGYLLDGTDGQLKTENLREIAGSLLRAIDPVTTQDLPQMPPVGDLVASSTPTLAEQDPAPAMAAPLDDNHAGKKSPKKAPNHPKEKKGQPAKRSVKAKAAPESTGPVSQTEQEEPAAPLQLENPTIDRLRGLPEVGARVRLRVATEQRAVGSPGIVTGHRGNRARVRFADGEELVDWENHLGRPAELA